MTNESSKNLARISCKFQPNTRSSSHVGYVQVMGTSLETGESLRYEDALRPFPIVAKGQVVAAGVFLSYKLVSFFCFFFSSCSSYPCLQ